MTGAALGYIPEVLALCDNCEQRVTEDDEFLFDAEGYVHAGCQPHFEFCECAKCERARPCRECRQYASHADWCSKFEHHPECPAANYRGVCGPK